jgi:hypothetical protein
LVEVSSTARQQFAETALPTYAWAVVAVTVSTVEPVTAPRVALIVEVPPLTPVATPAVVMVATEGVAEPQVTLDVRFCVLPSL